MLPPFLKVVSRPLTSASASRTSIIAKLACTMASSCECSPGGGDAKQAKPSRLHIPMGVLRVQTGRFCVASRVSVDTPCTIFQRRHRQAAPWPDPSYPGLRRVPYAHRRPRHRRSVVVGHQGVVSGHARCSEPPGESGLVHNRPTRNSSKKMRSTVVHLTLALSPLYRPQ